jgi:hypothetical protein
MCTLGIEEKIALSFHRQMDRLVSADISPNAYIYPFACSRLIRGSSIALGGWKAGYHSVGVNIAQTSVRKRNDSKLVDTITRVKELFK